MISVSSEVKIYEIDGNEISLKPGASKVLFVKSHWNRGDFVVIEFPGFDGITVSATDLKAAVENAQNISKY